MHQRISIRFFKPLTCRYISQLWGMGDIIFWADIQNLLHKLCIAFHLSLIPGFRLLLDLSFKNKGRSSFQKLFLLQLPSDKKIVAKTNKVRSEEHTSELQSRGHLVCRLLLEKKKK